MPFIKVNTQGVNGLCSSVTGVKNKTDECYSNLSRVKNNLQWKVQAHSNISGRINSLQRRIAAQEDKLDAYIRILQAASNTFYEKDRQIGREAKKLTYELRKMRFLTANPLITKYSPKADVEIDIISRINDMFHLGNDGLKPIILRFFKGTSNGLKGLESLADNETMGNELKFMSGIFSYGEALVKTFTGKYTDGYDAISNILSLTDGSAKMESGLYKYYLNKLNADDAVKFYNKNSGFINGVSIFGGVVGTLGQAVKTIKTARNADSSGSEKAASYIDLIGKGAETVGNTHIISKYGQEIWDSIKKKVVPVDAVGKKAAGARLGVITSMIDAGSSGVRKYGEVTEDGKFDLGDAGAVGMSVGINGLVSVLSKAVPGGDFIVGGIEAITGKDADDLTDCVLNEFDEIGDESDKWVEQHEDVRRFLADESKSRTLRNLVGCAIVVNRAVEHFNIFK